MRARRAIAIAVGIAAYLTAAPDGRAQPSLLSPGDLNQVHASIDGDDECGKCHESGKQVVARLCLACHQDLAAKLAAGAGLHGRQYRGKACEQCHVEHIGRKAKLVRWPGGAMEKLDHRQTGWPLEGDHRTATCLACHKKTSSLGRTQFLGTSSACGSCHKDPHAGRFGATCQSCHNETDFKAFDRAKFDHSLAKFRLTGKHQKVACDGCHGEPPKWKPVGFSGCDSCHRDPHRGEFKPKPCASCHDTSSWAGATDAIRDNHPGVSLKNGHRRVRCVTCHDRGSSKPPSRGDDCVDCHRPVHEAKFGTSCEGCHKQIKWLGLPEEVGRAAHAKTPYPLLGKHAAVTCSACHPSSKPPQQRFRRLVFDRCGGCHADKHAGEFAARDRGECGACHDVAGFAPTTFGVVGHATTKFPIDGKHVAVACSGCHPGARPRLDLRVAKRACADCHANPHGTQFAAELARGGCASCHATADWHLPRIDHSIWPLTGAHARAACAGCHGKTTSGATPAAYRGVPRTCEGCHDDVHAGQFRTGDPARGCADCHDTTTYELPRFDHAATARYPLDGKHAAVKCASCHPTVELRNGSRAVRYRLGYRRCKDCHANPHGGTR